MELQSLLGFTKSELEKFVSEKFLEKPYRVKQILKWIYDKKEEDISKFSDIPLRFREELKQKFKVYSLTLVSKEISKLDLTTRYNFKTYDGYNFPCVYIPKVERNVVCVSTQIGCSIGCNFCNSGRTKFIRNLTCSEIVEQVLRVEKDVGRINSILFMGMGEPLLNYDNLVKSIKIFLDTEMFSLSKRRITVSTVGIVPNIYKLAEENLGVKLAISLHSCDDKIRKQLIKNFKFSIEEILQAGVYYAKQTKTKLTIEYVLIKNINDTQDDAYKLVQLLKKFVGNKKEIVKINLIRYNPTVAQNLFPPEEKSVENFKNILVRNKFLTFIRKPHGLDINSACGQLGF